ncbi:MAG TPA: HdeA/HdeB family chaperone [Pseudolabrys sp.]|nr:HdeA/HdeB family chaperone [Pseudolabrys sp.]
MRAGLKATIVSATVLYAGLASSSALAQGSKDRMIEQYSCKDIMRESGPSREVAIAFMRGFLLGKAGSTKFNIDVLHKQSDEFIERCLANPDEKAMDAMSKIIG